MVRTHPETGKKALFLGPPHQRPCHQTAGGGEELLDELRAHTTQEKFTWTQSGRSASWCGGTIVAPCTAMTPPSTRPLSHRTRLKGTRPV